MSIEHVLTLGDTLYNVVTSLASFVGDIFFTTLQGLLERYISQVDGFPKLQAVISALLSLLTENFPIIASATFFEFCCGTALLAVVIIEFAVWLPSIFK